MKYILLFAIMFTFACDQKPKTSPTPKPTTPKQTTKATPKTNAKVAPKTATLTIPKEGKSLKPPVAKDKIPQGAFFCDMGTVHYARMEKADGKCPLCGMALVQKGAATPNTKEHKDHDHKGHDHKH